MVLSWKFALWIMMLSLFFVTFFRLKSLQVSEREGGSLIYNNIIWLITNYILPLLLKGHPRLVNAIGKLYTTLLKREIDPLSEVSFKLILVTVKLPCIQSSLIIKHFSWESLSTILEISVKQPPHLHVGNCDHFLQKKRFIVYETSCLVVWFLMLQIRYIV